MPDISACHNQIDELGQLEQMIFENPAFGELFSECYEKLHPVAGSRVLEIGCGEGHESIFFACKGAIVFGVDKRSTAIEASTELANKLEVSDTTTFEKGKVESLRFQDNSFDIVFSKSVLQYTDRATVIEECLRVLKPGGTLVLIENLAHNPVIMLVRVARSLICRSPRDRAYLNSINSHLPYKEAIQICNSLNEPEWQARHLTSAFTYLWIRSPKLPNYTPIVFFHRTLGLVDKLLFNRIPWTYRFAWIGCMKGKKVILNSCGDCNEN